MLSRVYIFTKKILASILLLSLVISSLFFVETISNSFIEYYSDRAKQLYGSFDNLLFNNRDTSVLDDYLPNVQEYIDYYGIISVLDRDEDLIVGQVDANAFELGGIYVAEGEFPANDNEICLSRSIFYERYSTNTIGDTIVFNDNEYIFVGIINDYSTVWNSSNDLSKFYYPNALVIFSENNITENSIVLIKNKMPFPSKIYENTYDLVVNTNAVSMNKSNQYIIPTFIINIIRLMIFVVAFYVYLYISNKDLVNYDILVKMGAKQYEIMSFIILKNTIISFVSSILGCYTGRFISYIVIYTYNSIYSTNVVWNIMQSEKSNVFICMMFCCVSFILLLCYKKKITRKIKIKNIINFDKYSLKYELFNNLKTLSVMSCCVFSFVLVIVICNIYINMYSATLGDVWGRMKIDYDYQFTSKIGNIENYSYIDYDGSEVNVLCLPDDDTVYNLPNYNNTISSEVILDIQNESCIDSVANYYEANSVYMGISNVEIDEEYANGFPVDGNLSNTITNNICLNADLYRRVHFYTFQEEEIVDLENYSMAGNIDLNKVASGEEVILIVPVYEIIDYGDGAWGLNFVENNGYNSSNKLIKDDTFHVGDTVSLCQIQPQNRLLMGCISLDQLINDTIVNEREFRIGAIIYERVMWFDDASEMPTAYTFIGTADTMINSGFIPDFSRTQICLNDGISNDAAGPIISKYQNELKDFDFRNNIVEMEDYRQFSILLKSICYTITVLCFVIVLFTMLAEQYYMIKSQMKKYMLFRFIGVPPTFFIRQLVCYFFIVLIGSCSVFYTVGMKCITFYFNDVNSVKDFFGNINVIILLFTMNILSVAINAIVYIPLFRKYPVFEH